MAQRGRISKLANPEFAKSVGEAYADGMSRPDMAELFGAHVDTITEWVRDPRVQAHAGRFMQERVGRITKITDREILRRLEDADDEEKMPTELLLKIRKELLGRALDAGFAQDRGGAKAETIHDVLGSLEEDPEMAKKLKEMVGGASVSD